MWSFTRKGDKKTKYLLNIDFDENDEVLPRFTPITEHQKLTGPGLDPGDIVGGCVRGGASGARGIRKFF